MWFKRKRQRATEKRTVRSITFISEQDGPIERQLKTALLPAIRRAGAERAYLARASFQGSPDTAVILCLAAPENSSAVREISEVFAVLFNASEHLDILFLTGSRHEASLSAVCRPFFVAGDTPTTE